MVFKKFRGQIFDVDLNAKERQVLNQKVNELLITRHGEFVDDVDYMILYILHNRFGFGAKRMRQFYEAFLTENEKLIKHYEMSDAGVYVARKEMNSVGVDFEKWNNERRDGFEKMV